MRICSIAGCGKPHRAKGLCATHYNQQSPTWHAIVKVPCAVCGEIVERRPDNARRGKVACSVECRAILQFGEHGGSGYDWAMDAARRARNAGAVVQEVFDRLEIFERDGWICGICDEPVNAELDPFDSMSATVDHVIPLVLGGVHSRENVQCAHLGCNSKKDNQARRLIAA